MYNTLEHVHVLSINDLGTIKLIEPKHAYIVHTYMYIYFITVY